MQKRKFDNHIDLIGLLSLIKVLNIGKSSQSQDSHFQLLTCILEQNPAGRSSTLLSSKVVEADVSPASIHLMACDLAISTPVLSRLSDASWEASFGF